MFWKSLTQFIKVKLILRTKSKFLFVWTAILWQHVRWPCPCFKKLIFNLHFFSSYSYIDQAEAIKEHRPVIPKKMTEPKKMVRYRDNKIVSLRGERYTESRDDDSEPRKPKKALP